MTKKRQNKSMTKRVAKAAASAAASVVANRAGKKKRKSNKQKNSKGMGKGLSLRGGSSVNIGAAVDFGKIMTNVSFAKARSEPGYGEGLNVRCTLPALELGLATGAAINDSAVFGVSSSSTPLTTPISLDPSVSNRWINAVIPLLTGIFDRYRVNSVQFHYRPAAGNTSLSAPMAFGACSDYNHPNWTSPTVAKLLGFGDSFEFNVAWEAWDLSYRLPHGNLLYSYDVGSSSGDVRFQDAGAFAILTMASSANLVKYGLLYITWDVDMYELAPVYKTVSFDETGTVSGLFDGCRRMRFDRLVPRSEQPARRLSDETKTEEFEVVDKGLESLMARKSLNGLSGPRR